MCFYPLFSHVEFSEYTYKYFEKQFTYLVCYKFQNSIIGLTGFDFPYTPLGTLCISSKPSSTVNN